MVGDPVGPGGKTPVLTSHGANIHVDDRQDVCDEASRANIFTIPVYKSYNLSWWPQLENAIRDKGVDYFILNHSPVPLRGDQFFASQVVAFLWPGLHRHPKQTSPNDLVGA